MLLFLALSACFSPEPTEIVVESDGAEGFAMAAPASDLPAGAAKVNWGCFGDAEESFRVGGAPSTTSSGGSGYGGGPAGASTPVPPPSPTPDSRRAESTSSAKADKPKADAGAKAPKPEAAAPAEPAPAVEREASAGRDRQVPAKEEKSVALADEDTSETPVVTQSQQALDWGAVVYLSNDDSMSLASAQRVLWAVQNDKPFTSREVRPHELLNYFSFDTAPVPAGKLFSVQASGEKTAPETMTVALAVKGATPPRKPLDLTVVLDRSGSMRAEGRMEYTKKGLTLMSDQLKRGDRVDVVLFDNEVCTPLEDYVVGRDDPALLSGVIEKLAPRGATNIGIGLKEAYRIVSQEGRNQGSRRNRRVMLMTDALVNQGFVDADVLAQVGKAYEQQGVRLTGVGVGREFDDTVLDKLTEAGKGAYVYLGSDAVVERVFGASFDSLVQTIAHDVQFSIDLPPSLAMERFYGEEASTDAADVQPIHYYAGTTQLFLQDLRVDPKKLVPTEKLTLKIAYREAATGEPASQSFSWTVGELMGADSHNLDKGRALMAWTDMLQARAMGADPCNGPSATYAERAAEVEGDAEIGYVTSLASKWCSIEVPESVVTSVQYKVKVDSDVPIAEVVLACGGDEWKDKLSGSDTVARFDVAKPGSCSLTLQGATPLVTQVKIPATGGDVKCTVRAGRLSCG